jgi:hypothetical protein
MITMATAVGNHKTNDVSTALDIFVYSFVNEKFTTVRQ